MIFPSIAFYYGNNYIISAVLVVVLIFCFLLLFSSPSRSSQETAIHVSHASVSLSLSLSPLLSRPYKIILYISPSWSILTYFCTHTWYIYRHWFRTSTADETLNNVPSGKKQSRSQADQVKYTVGDHTAVKRLSSARIQLLEEPQW